MLVILGDFNAHIGNLGGPRSFHSINERGKELSTLMQTNNLKSVNSQLFCRGPIETFFAQNGLITTTTDHVFVKADDLLLVTDCYVQKESCVNLSFHLPIFCSLDIECFSYAPSNTPEPYVGKLSWKLVHNLKIQAKYQKCLKKKLDPRMEDIIGS